MSHSFTHKPEVARGGTSEASFTHNYDDILLLKCTKTTICSATFKWYDLEDTKLYTENDVKECISIVLIL
jgi:hypothetical protein